MWYLYPDILANINIRKIDGKFHISSFEEKIRPWGPEEIIRQFMYIKLVCHYGYGLERIKIEYPIQIGSKKGKADIVVFNRDYDPYIIVETKVKETKSSKNQLHSYINASRAEFGILASQSEIKFFRSLERSLIQIEDIPISDQHMDNMLVGKSPVVDMLEFEKLMQIDDEKSIIIINNKELYVKNEDFSTYKKIRNKALKKGIALRPDVDEQHWGLIVKALFDSAEEAFTRALPYKDVLLNFIQRHIKDYQKIRNHDYKSEIENRIIVYNGKIMLKRKGIMKLMFSEEGEAREIFRDKKAVIDTLKEVGFEYKSERIEGAVKKVYSKDLADI